MAKSAVAQSDCNVIVNACAKTLCQRVHIADPGGVVYRSRPKDFAPMQTLPSPVTSWPA